MATLHDRWYEWLYQFKEMQDLDVGDTGAHTRIKRILRSASRLIESRTGDRHFYPVVDTRTLDWQSDYELRLDQDLISVTTLTNGDGNTISASSYKLYPPEEPWKRRIHMVSGSSDKFTYDYEPHQAISVEGVWGYWDVSEDPGETIQDGGGINASVTSLTVVDGDNFDVGQMLKIEDEAVFVEDRNTTTNILTIQRAKLGTTAASHANGIGISIYRAPEDIEIATSIVAARLFKRWESVWADVIGAGPSRRAYNKGIPQEVIDLIGNFIYYAI